MADALLQTLTIKLNAEVGNTKRKLNDVATSVEKLEEIGKKADWSVFEQIRTNLEGIAKIDFSNVADSLKDVVTTMKALGISAKEVKNATSTMTSPRMEDSAVSETTEPSWQLQGVRMVANVFSAGTKYLQEFNAKIAEAKKGVHDVQDAFDPWRRSLAGCYLELNQIEFLVNQIKSKGAPVADFDALKQQLLEAGFSLNKVNELLSQIGKSNGFGNWEESLRQCGLTANEVSVVIKDLFESQREPIDFEKLKDVLISLGFSADEAEATMAKLGKATKKAGKDAEQGSKGFKKMLNSIKRITFYRMVRRAIQLVGQAITQGIQDMALFDADFNKSMSEIKSSLTYFKNSLGAMIAPIVEMIQPILTMFLDLFAELNNELGKMFSMLNGKNQFAKATKGAEDYAESLKKAQSISLGIDELNVAQKQEDQNFVTEETGGGSGALGGLFANLKDSLEPLIEKFKEGFMPILNAIMNIFTAISPILNIVVKLFTQLINETMDSVNTSILDFINMLGSVIEFISAIIQTFEPILKLIIHWISTFINTFNESLSTLFNILKPIFNVLTVIWNGISFVLSPILKGISAFLEKMIDIGKKIVDFFKNTIGGNVEDKPAGQRIAMAFLTGGLSELIGGIRKATSHANGGFVEDGFFYANHNELVGQFSNGQTAVANNAQIVEGIKQGVMDAILESGGLGGSQGSREIVVQIDGREIGRASEKYEAQKGEKIFSGGYHYGF